MFKEYNRHPKGLKATELGFGNYKDTKFLYVF